MILYANAADEVRRGRGTPPLIAPLSNSATKQLDTCLQGSTKGSVCRNRYPATAELGNVRLWHDAEIGCLLAILRAASNQYTIHHIIWSGFPVFMSYPQGAFHLFDNLSCCPGEAFITSEDPRLWEPNEVHWCILPRKKSCALQTDEGYTATARVMMKSLGREGRS